MVVGSADVDLGIKVNIDQPEQAGADRLVNAVGARGKPQPTGDHS